jgi:nitrite reductase (NADH) large subunit
MAERLLIVGNGMASVRLLEELTRADAGRYLITVVGAEPSEAYNRVLLSALLAGDVARKDIVLRDAGWYAARGIRLISGDAVLDIDAGARQARLASGEVLGFDRCVFATGSDAVRLPLPGIDLPGVMTFRDLADVAAMDRVAAAHGRIAVIGGGLLGIEAAYGLAKRGADVTLVHVMDRLMERQLDVPAAGHLRRALRRLGIKVLLNRQTVAITGEAAATGLGFADGSGIEADLVVCAVGIRPNAALAKGAGLAVQRGIVVDDRLSASLDGFHAIGECAEHRAVAYGLVEPAYEQARVLAAVLTGNEAAFTGMVLATNLKVSGVPVFSAGDFLGGEGTNCAVLEDRDRGVYRKLVFREDALVGCVLVGEAEDGLWYLDLIRRSVSLGEARRALLHGRQAAEALLPVTGNPAPAGADTIQPLAVALPATSSLSKAA